MIIYKNGKLSCDKCQEGEEYGIVGGILGV